MVAAPAELLEEQPQVVVQRASAALRAAAPAELLEVTTMAVAPGEQVARLVLVMAAAPRAGLAERTLAMAAVRRLRAIRARHQTWAS